MSQPKQLPLFSIDFGEVYASVLQDPRVRQEVMSIMKDPGVRREFLALIHFALDEREAKQRMRLLTDQEMADAIGCSLKTFRRRYKECPDTLGRLARKPGVSAERWPREEVLEWWWRNR